MTVSRLRDAVLAVAAVLALAAAPAPRAVAAQAPKAKVPPPRKLTKADSARLLVFNREQFAYDGRDRRDPFLNPIASGEARPMLVDLVVTGILYDPAGRRSVAVMRDNSDKAIYRVKIGESLGRAKVTRIAPRAVYVTIDEFGFMRQDSLLFAPPPTVPPPGGAPAAAPAPPPQTRTP